MSDTTASLGFPEKYGVEWWYTAHFVYGAIQLIFIPILVPTFVLSVTESATMAGAALTVIGLGGFLAPVIGGLADKYRAHRLAQLAGLAAYALGGVLFAFLGQSPVGIFGGAACMGIGSATLLMINPAFVVSAGFAPDDEASRLTRLNQVMIIGSVIFGFVLNGLIASGLSYPVLFLVLSALAVAGLVVAAATNTEAAARIKVVETSEEDGGGASGGLAKLLISPFGLFLLAVYFVTVGQGTITGQAANYLNDVFTIDPGTTSSALSVSGIISLIVLDLVGRVMGKTGPGPVWLVAVLLKIATMVLLILLALSGGLGAIIPLAVYIGYLLAITCVDMVQPALAARGSSAGAGTTQGLLMFAIASAYATGSFLSGVAADSLGFASLPWIVAIVSTIALVLGFFAIGRQKSSA